MPSMVRKAITFSLLLVGFTYITHSQCNLFTPADLGNDTILCPGETLAFNFSGLQDSPIITWENGSHSTSRIINTPGTYAVEFKYHGQNLVINGDFSQGNTGFLTDYLLGTGGTWGLVSNEGTYAITTSPSYAHNNFSYCNDHTGGGGNMMVVNGAGSPGTNVWCQTIDVDPNTDYEFSTWITNALFDFNVAQLQFSINGVPLGNVFTTSTSGCNWEQFYEVWNSGTNTTANICIMNLNTQNGGNDFAIDDISFSPICLFTDTIEVAYNSFPVFTLPTEYNSCEGEFVELNAENTGFDYNWATGETTQTIEVTQPGTYSVDVSDNGYCEETQTFEVNFNQPPNAGNDWEFDFCNTESTVDLKNLIEPGISTTGYWIDNANAVLPSTIINIEDFEGEYNYKYIVEEDFCPSDTANYTLNVSKYYHAGQDFTQHICNSSDLVLTQFLTGSNVGYWESIDGLGTNNFNTNTGLFTPNGLPKDDYSFRFIVENNAPCLNDTAIAVISVSEMPEVDFDADKYEGCSPVNIQFEDLTVVNGTKNYEWRVNGEVFGNSEQASYTFEDVYCYDISLKVTTDNLCSNELTLPDFICVNPDPIANFSFAPATVFSDNPHVTFKNQSELNVGNQWKFDSYGESYETHPSFDFPTGKQANYVVQLVVTSDKGCTDTISKVVPVIDQTIFYVPNAFTPDGNSFNNTFAPVMGVGVDPNDYHLKVYNRWGEVVFESYDYNVGWDGAYGNKMAPDGVYVWKIRFNDLHTDTHFETKGFVTLIR